LLLPCPSSISFLVLGQKKMEKSTLLKEVKVGRFPRLAMEREGRNILRDR